MTDLSPEARAIVDAARAAEHPSAADKLRIQAAVAAGIAAGAAGTASAAGAASATGAASGAGLGKLALVVAIAGAIGTGGAWLGGAFDRPDERELQLRPAPAAELRVERAQPPAPPIAAPEPAAVAAPDPDPKPRRPRASPPGSIDQELALMFTARKALRDGDAAAALAALDEHAQTFPRGQTIQERESLRVLALCAAGRTDEARATAERFFERWPTSVHAERVRRSCAGE